MPPCNSNNPLLHSFRRRGLFGSGIGWIPERRSGTLRGRPSISSKYRIPRRESLPTAVRPESQFIWRRQCHFNVRIGELYDSQVIPPPPPSPRGTVFVGPQMPLVQLLKHPGEPGNGVEGDVNEMARPLPRPRFGRDVSSRNKDEAVAKRRDVEERFIASTVALGVLGVLDVLVPFRELFLFTPQGKGPTAHGGVDAVFVQDLANAFPIEQIEALDHGQSIRCGVVHVAFGLHGRDDDSAFVCGR